MKNQKSKTKNQKFDADNLLIINCEKETKRITDFIKTTLINAGFKKVIIGISGGVDSATVLALCVKALGAENVIAVAMPCGDRGDRDGVLVVEKLEILKENVLEIDIEPIVRNFQFSIFNFQRNSKPKIINLKHDDNVRLGNIIARVRMTVLYDLAKQHKALVCGTENKSEDLLGYYTRFGDEASDLEPIKQLYKTQVYQLAKYLEIPEAIINKKPTAGLWDGQTDETELGFTYEEADNILQMYFDEKNSWQNIKLKVESGKLEIRPDLINKIQERVEGIWFKREVPYAIKAD